MAFLNTRNIPKKTNIWVDRAYLRKFINKGRLPKWCGFCEFLLNHGFSVFVYVPESANSVYVTIVRNNKKQVIRFSNHLPKVESWLGGEIDYYAGPKELGMLSVKEVSDGVRSYFGF